MSNETTTEGRRVAAQFGEMLVWLNRGWRPAAAGFACPYCGGARWAKVFGRVERFMCVMCGLSEEYTTR